MAALTQGKNKNSIAFYRIVTSQKNETEHNIKIYKQVLSHMKLFSKKLDLITLIAIVIMAISVSMLDFDNLSWSNNIKSYVGLIISAILFAFKYLILRRNEVK